MRPLFCALLLRVVATGLPDGRLLEGGISARLGVRYADQPKRFQRASLANGWKDEQGNAMDKPAKACPQAKLMPGLETSEDCLFLNIFGPTNPPPASSLLPVIVYIHGGAYKFGSGNEFTVENLGNLSNHDQVIVVTVQYRLSVLGFFYPHFPSSKFHANLGLDDTHLAIKFISKNIHE
ncbi:unnamed protein product, partial [Mesorhabditis belari]|uniref:Carboxylesterase type B domain-containing protein n=1 Tax=Mesorhabditis belari TaxID=2138241 RepID=A0AAF3J8K7_9BILA